MAGPATEAGNPWTWIRSHLAQRRRCAGHRRSQQPQRKAVDGRRISFPRRLRKCAASSLSPFCPSTSITTSKLTWSLQGEGGVRFQRQEIPTSFTDVTAPTKLPPALLNAAYTGAWAIDVEADGDMDILLSHPSGISASPEKQRRWNLHRHPSVQHHLRTARFSLGRSRWRRQSRCCVNRWRRHSALLPQPERRRVSTSFRCLRICRR